MLELQFREVAAGNENKKAGLEGELHRAMSDGSGARSEQLRTLNSGPLW